MDWHIDEKVTNGKIKIGKEKASGTYYFFK